MSVMDRVDAALGTTQAGPTGVTAEACVRTPLGLKRIALLREGDLVVTRTAGPQPLVAVHHRRISRRDLRADPGCAPISLSPRALGPMMPAQPLVVAPGQTVRVPSHLIDPKDTAHLQSLRAADLPDHFPGATRMAETDAVTYVSLVFSEPRVLLVNGAMVETTPERPSA